MLPSRKAPAVFWYDLRENTLMARIALFIVFVCVLFDSPAHAGPEQRGTVTGKIVAYSGALSCVNGNSYWSMMIREWNGKRASAQFIEVRFSVPCYRSPEWLFGKQAMQTFHLIRDRLSDGVLAGSLNESTGQGIEHDPKSPIWTLVPGAEEEKLPFGQIVRCYLSADLPPAPIF
jgi:hypothetical protein